jgi:hypothetical protein
MRWPVYSEQLSRQPFGPTERVIDAAALLCEIRVECAHDDTRVRESVGMEPDKVATIQRRHGSAVGGSQRQHGLVGQSLLRVAEVG